MSRSPIGPHWVGIGAQRSGTTWFVDLLTEHPEVSLGRSSEKELHILESGLVTPFEGLEDAFRMEFDGLTAKVGEFTPAYLRCLWVPAIARRLLPGDVTLFVVLRDPIDRFASAMSHEIGISRRMSTPGQRHLSQWSKFRGVDATWAGMYATQLEAWLNVFPKDQIHLIQYEEMKEAPESILESAWAALDVDPVPIPDPTRRSSTTTPVEDLWDWSGRAALLGSLRDLYRPEVIRLERHWGINTSLWPNFAAESR